MKKAIKVLGIVGGVLVFSEIFGIAGEAQAFNAMSKKYKDEVDDCLDVLENSDEYLDGKKHPYVTFKSKVVANLTKLYMKNS